MILSVEFLSFSLERLSTTKAVVLLLEFPNLLRDLFETFFECLRSFDPSKNSLASRENHSALIGVHIMDILASSIEESDEIDTEIVEILLMNLVWVPTSTSPFLVPNFRILRVKFSIREQYWRNECCRDVWTS